MIRSIFTFDKLCILSSQYHGYGRSSHCFTSSAGHSIVYCIRCAIVVRITQPKTSHGSVPQHRIRIGLFSPRIPALHPLSKKSLLSFLFRFLPSCSTSSGDASDRSISYVSVWHLNNLRRSNYLPVW